MTTLNTELGGPACDLVSRTGPPVRIQWEPGRNEMVRICDPPIPVLVSMKDVDPSAGALDFKSNKNHPSLRVRAAGLRFEPVEPASLLAWVKLCDGQWRAIVLVELHSSNGRTGLTIPLYVSHTVVRRRNARE